MEQQPDIFCPACEYKPKLDDRWDCVPSCGTKWHTFWTRGVCPGCGHTWTKTQCPSCTVVSPHEAWYHYPVSSGEPEKQEQPIKENA